MRETIKALTGASLIYGIPLDNDQVRAYLAVLTEHGASDERIAAGVRAACTVCKFMPKPADILEHMPQYRPNQKQIGAGDDIILTPQEVEFNKAAFPLLNLYLDRKLTRHEYLGRLRWEAKKAGVENKIDWTEFGHDTPWNPGRATT